MISLRPRRCHVNIAAAVAVAVLLLLPAGCGSDDKEEGRTSAASTESSPSTQAPPPDGVNALADFDVMAFDPATGELSAVLSEGPQETTDTTGEGPLIVDAETEIVVQGPDRPEKLPLDQLDPWIRQRLTDLGDTANAVRMEVSYRATDDQRKVLGLTEVPPG